MTHLQLTLGDITDLHMPHIHLFKLQYSFYLTSAYMCLQSLGFMSGKGVAIVTIGR